MQARSLSSGPSTSNLYRLISATAVLLLLLLGTACKGEEKRPLGERQPRATATPQSEVPAPTDIQPSSLTPQPIFTTQQIGNLQVTVQAARHQLTSSRTPIPQGRKWVIIQVSARNSGAQPYTIDANKLVELEDARGNRYRRIDVPTSDCCFADGPIQPRFEIRGEVAFEVPSNLTAFKFIVTNNEGDTGVWTLPILAAE